jgi:hypothetical protein
MATDPEYDGEARFDVPLFVSGLIFGSPFPDGEVPEDTGDPGMEWSPSRMLDLVEESPAGPTSMTILEGLAPRTLNSYDRVRLMREMAQAVRPLRRQGPSRDEGRRRRRTGSHVRLA